MAKKMGFDDIMRLQVGLEEVLGNYPSARALEILVTCLGNAIRSNISRKDAHIFKVWESVYDDLASRVLAMDRAAEKDKRSSKRRR